MSSEAARRADWLSRRIGQEIRNGRRMRGWSQRELGERSGVPQTVVSRVERGWAGGSIGLLCALTAAVGLDLNAQVFPSKGIRVRDERQLAYVRHLIDQANPLWHPTIEARVTPDPSDNRAIDLVLASAIEMLAMEVERDLRDYQGEVRPDLAKRDLLASRESRPVRFILALPDTRRLRQFIRDNEALVARTLPAPSRHIWSSIRSGKPVGADGVLWLPPSIGSRRTVVGASRA
jgi:transcriptional regulator with XRE-family HTH domain